MSDIKMRLDKVRALIQKPEFLEGKGRFLLIWTMA